MWNEDLALVREEYRALGVQHRAECIEAWRTRSFPQALFRALGAKGLYRAVGRERFGFPGGIPYFAAALEGLTSGTLDGGLTISLSTHGVLAVGSIERYASPRVAAQYLEGLRTGEMVAAFAVTEPKGGSDGLNPHCTVRPRGDDAYILQGQKWHITNVPNANVFVILAQEAESRALVAVIVERGWEGVEVSAPMSPIGARSSPVGSLVFHDVVVPREHVLGLQGDGAKLLREAFVAERILAGFPCIGAMDTILDQMVRYSREREIQGRPIGDYQQIQRRITEVKLGLETTRCLAHAALQRFASGEDMTLESSLVKLHGTRTAVDVVGHWIALFGVHGFQEEHGRDMVLLDALASTIGGGTEEVQRNVIYQQLVRRQRRSNFRSFVVPTKEIPACNPR